MPEPLKVVPFPESAALNVPAALRKIADQIEAGEYDDAHNLAWVIDCGSGRIEIGLCGQAPEPGITTHYLYALGMRKLEMVNNA